MTNFVQGYNFLSKEECSKIIKSFWEHQQYIESCHTEYRHGKENRYLYLHPMQYGPFPFKSKMIDLMDKALQNYINKFSLEQEFSDTKTFWKYFNPGHQRIQRTNEEWPGTDQWHYEKGRDNDRRLVFMIYLNEDFDGGKTEFKFCPDLDPHGHVGELYIFPADFTHTHKAAKVLNGDKYIMTGWFHDGPRQ